MYIQQLISHRQTIRTTSERLPYEYHMNGDIVEKHIVDKNFIDVANVRFELA